VSVLRYALALLFLAAGCAGRALPVPLPVDGARDLGGGDNDAATCGLNHERTAVPLTELALLGGGNEYFDDATVRVHIAYALREGCDVPADTVVTPLITSSAGGMSITAFAWLGSGSCGPTRTITEDVQLPLITIDGLFVEDGAPNAVVPQLMLTLDMVSAPCGTVPLGDVCHADCDCAAASANALCLSGSDGVLRCGHPCDDDVDCAFVPEGATCLGPPSRVCGATTACRDAQDCGYGEVVTNCVCTRPVPAPVPSSCCEDSDCPSGTLCASTVCIIPCTDDSSCPDPCGGEGCMFCDQGACDSFI
jgi:hypothetical protein